MMLKLPYPTTSKHSKLKYNTIHMGGFQKRSRQTHIFNQTNNIKFQIKISQKRNFELMGGFGGNMGKKSCNFFGSREFPVDVGSTKAIGLEVSRGSNERLVVPECLICMALNLKGVTIWENLLKLVDLEVVSNGSLDTAIWCFRLYLVRVKAFPENILFSRNAIFWKGKCFHVFGCHKIHFTEN